MNKVIFLVDMNAFYISCESIRRPEIVGKPAAVAGNPQKRSGIILTANYEARKYGIRTTMVVNEALRLCPDLILIPPDHKFYNEKSKEVMVLLQSYTPIIEQNSIDEAWLDMTGCTSFYGSPFNAANDIMKRINNEIGLWCSIGISENKFLSKMASDMRKPHGITELWKKDIDVRLWPLPVNKMYGVGDKTYRKLASMGIFTIRDLATFDRMMLIKHFGKKGDEMYLNANGIDTSFVKPNDESDIKSIGRSVTLPENITDIEKAKNVILELSDDISMTCMKHNKKGRTVQINIKYHDFKNITRQMTIPATFSANEIYRAGVELLKSHWNEEPVRLLGISISNFEDEVYEQISLFNMMDKDKGDRNSLNSEKLDRAIYSLREKYGYSKINRGIILDKR